jgi:hypothetical protein
MKISEKRKHMRGMKSSEFIEMVNFVQKYHKFALCMSDVEVSEMQKLYPNMSEYCGLNIKYIDSCYDSRFSDIWSVSFRGMGHNVFFHTNTDLTLPYDSLFDWIMAYLKKEWIPTDIETKSITKN